MDTFQARAAHDAIGDATLGARIEASVFPLAAVHLGWQLGR
jgi:hypothetical protein